MENYTMDLPRLRGANKIESFFQPMAKLQLPENIIPTEKIYVISDVE